MSVRRLADQQPASFAFTPANEERCEEILKKYPEGREASAVISLLWLAQKQNNYWLPKPAIETVAEKLGMAFERHTELNGKPVAIYGKASPVEAIPLGNADPVV